MGGDQENRGAASPPIAAREAALFGFREGVAWVADDAFVTRSNGSDLLVERWVGQRVVSIIVREAREGIMRAMWSKLNEVAMDAMPKRAL